jgi:hypothetical protein
MMAMEESQAVQIAKALGDIVRFSIYKHISEANEMRCRNIGPLGRRTVETRLPSLFRATVS